MLMLPTCRATRLGLPLLRCCWQQRTKPLHVAYGHWAISKEHTRLRVAAAKAAKQSSQAQPPEWDVNTAGSSKDWQRSDLHVVLVHPQIPQNAGNVSRTCAATSVSLHLVGPLGFDIDSRKLKRAGLDYWDFVCVAVHPSWEDFYAAFQQQPGSKRLVAFSKFARQHYAAPNTYRRGEANWLLFGAETTGLPLEAHQAAMQHGAVVKIPMVERHVRSLNLATSVGIGVYEAVRQLDGAVLPEEQQLDPLSPWSDYNAVEAAPAPS